jgi:AraC family transcriptional regulator
VSAISLEDLPRSSMSGEFDALQLYIPHSAMQQFTQVHDLDRLEALRWPRADVDPTASALAALLLPALEQPDPSQGLLVEHVTLAFLAHVAQRYRGAPTLQPTARGRLAPWQERRAKEMMRARLATSLSIAEVSFECRLSPSYFAAAFRRSTGRSPHRFLSEQRIEEAKNLLLNTVLPLADIGLLCGFGDQSHFTRVFTRLGGVSPGQWRRLYRVPPAPPVDDR